MPTVITSGLRMQTIVPTLGVINIVNYTFCGTRYAFQPDTVCHNTLDAQHIPHVDAELRHLRMWWTAVTPHGARQECAEAALTKPKYGNCIRRRRMRGKGAPSWAIVGHPGENVMGRLGASWAVSARLGPSWESVSGLLAPRRGLCGGIAGEG